MTTEAYRIYPRTARTLIAAIQAPGHIFVEVLSEHGGMQVQAVKADLVHAIGQYVADLDDPSPWCIACVDGHRYLETI